MSTSDAPKSFDPREFFTLLLTGLGGVGSAAGALFTALAYAPAQSKEILIALGVIIVVTSFSCYVFIGKETLAGRSFVLLALVFVISLSAAGLFEISMGGAHAGSPTPTEHTAPKYMMEVRAEDSLDHDPLELNLIRNFKIVTIDSNSTPRKVPINEDRQEIDLTKIKTVKITACNLTTEYNVEGLKVPTDKPIVFNVAFLIPLRSGISCSEGHGR